MDDATYNRIQVIRLSHAPEDAVRFWIREGLLRGPDLGPRKRLRFDRNEVKIAAFLREARNNGMNVAAMRQLVTKIRAGLDLHGQFDFSLQHIVDGREVREGRPVAEIEELYRKMQKRPEEQAAAGIISQEKLDHFRTTKAGRQTVEEAIEEVCAAAVSFPYDRFEEWILGDLFATGSDILLAWQDGSGEWQTDNGFPQDWRLPAPSVVVFDWAQICAIDWDTAGRGES